MIVTGIVGALAAGLLAAVPATTAPAVAAAANPITPGNFTGYGFDQCETVNEAGMRKWRRHSPFRAVGIYISGDSRACKRQANLTPSWVRNPLADGWRLLPITLGPQAACSTRFPRYGKAIDPTINPATANGYAAARAQGRAEADDAVATARRLGIVPGSTIFYDLEAFDIRRSTACTQSALWFTHAWTNRLHGKGYASGYYSSAASGIRMLDDERVRRGSKITLPDQIWIADWDGRANTASSYIRSDGWQPASRVKQYRGDHRETHGGVTINIDSNYLKLRTPRLPGAHTPAPAPAPSGPAYTGSNMSDPRCNPATINRASYRRTGPARTAGLVPLQCLLKQRKLYPYEVTGRWNTQTTTALQSFQRQVARPSAGFASRGDWVALHVRGNGASPLRAGSKGVDVIRLQRALNAATPARLRVSGSWNPATGKALSRYKRNIGLRATQQVTPATWRALGAGRW